LVYLSSQLKVFHGQSLGIVGPQANAEMGEAGQALWMVVSAFGQDAYGCKKSHGRWKAVKHPYFMYARLILV
jgi:hypothetical protein